MRVAVIGGGLQGIEAAYLARKAGWEVLLIDRKPAPPAVGLADHFVQCDVTAADGLESLMASADLALPDCQVQRHLPGNCCPVSRR